MGRMFWKFFLAFWLALLVAGGGVGTAVWLRHNAESASQSAGIDDDRPGPKLFKQPGHSDAPSPGLPWQHEHDFERPGNTRKPWSFQRPTSATQTLISIAHSDGAICQPAI
jgi:hypothetical protein